MPDFKLPKGWHADDVHYERSGCLIITLSYRKEAFYAVKWHVDDSVTQVGYNAANRALAYDPTVTALAQCWAAQHALTPRYPRDLSAHN